MVTLQLRQLEVPPGKCLLLHDVSWSDFESILAEMENHRSTRIAYDNGLSEIMVPLPEHEYFKETISDALKDISIDLTSKSLNRFPVYQRLGVPEIWCYAQGQLIVYRLQAGEYRQADQSTVFPALQ